MTAFIDVDASSRRRMQAGGIESVSAALRREFDTPFRFYDGSSGEPIRREGPGGRPASIRPEPARAIRAIAAGGRPRVDPSGPARSRIALPLRHGDGPPLVAVGHIAALARPGRQARAELARLWKWADAVQLRLPPAGAAGPRHPGPRAIAPVTRPR
ncbi:hypothetical protein [Tautonia plasticadhaerens]|uniref:Uncharacterized protein n=1 Tax=Tautonia plasticadhaerens TaxID=2527974 RepID=A0A518HBH4_9BACT|nr:hypothetical protein [Tautonia plasticadhaerens]QDV38214.1 hypothetical protein ElP_61650 [Tautonia plasticadhaerens]